MDALTIVSLVLGAIAVLFGAFWLNAKSKIEELANIGREALDVANVIIAAIDDNKITPEELAEIKKEIAEVKDAWKKLLGKS